MRRQWEAELLPQCLAMGIGYNEFWTLNPRKLKVYTEGYKLKRKVHDEEQWLLGGYVYGAVSAAIGNVLRKKNQKSQTYFDLIEKPFFKDMASEDIPEEEKQKYINAFMAQLHVMQNNFESKHGE